MTTLAATHDKILEQLPEAGTKMSAQEVSEVRAVCVRMHKYGYCRLPTQPYSVAPGFES
jgi:hypothetical protein